jgi:hypothetical protein
LAVATLVALAASAMTGWAVAFHLTDPDHHVGSARHHDGIPGLVLVLHGHAHEQDTPAHGHPLLTSSPARVSGRQVLVMPVLLGEATVLLAAGAGMRALPIPGPTHDPPPRPLLRPVLRI